MEVNVGVRPEVELAESVGVVPKFFAPGLANVIVCGAFGVTEVDAEDAVPVPLAFLAVTVKVYAVPFVSPITVSGLPAPVAVKLPGLDVTV